MSFLLFLVGFLEKENKSAKFGNFGFLRRGVGTPRRGVGPRHGVAWLSCGVAEREALSSLGYAAM